jgi:hypothetical protein
MKPVLSPARTGTLPSFLLKSTACSYTASSVRIVFTTSTSFISGTGLKKCMPMKRCWRSGEVAVIISVIDSDEVFEAKIVSGLHISSNLR